jgi:nickel/cobalt exporter
MSTRAELPRTAASIWPHSVGGMAPAQGQWSRNVTGMDRRAITAGLFAVAASLALSGAASAHPHVFVDARAEIVFDTTGRIEAVRNIWTFDEAFSSYATLNLDADGDGKLSDAELEPLAKVNVESLHEYAFFTYLTIGSRKAQFVDPTEYFLTYDGAQLTLYYTLPLKKPVAVDAQAKLEVFDPEYFVAFTFAKDNPAKLDGAPAGCKATFHPPGELDARTMAILGQIPADQREIPDDLVQAASVLANVIAVDCPKPAPGLAAVPAADPPAKSKPPSPFGIGTMDAPGGGWLRGPLGPFFIWIGQWQAEFYKALTSKFAAIKADGRAAWLLLALSFLYGIFHAAGPGHGKAVITSYLFATGESVKRGIGISFAAAFVQAFTAIAIVIVAAMVFRVAAETMTVTTQWVEIASYGLIVAVGLWLLWRQIFGGGHHHHHHDGAAGDDHDHDDHAHAHDHDHDHHHDHARLPRRPSRSGLISAILAVGIRPCSGAIIVLVFALSQHMLAVGVVSTLVMALGTGITVAVLATIAVSARGFAMQLAGSDSIAGHRIVHGLEIAAAGLVLILGVVLLGGALAAGLPGA